MRWFLIILAITAGPAFATNCNTDLKGNPLPPPTAVAERFRTVTGFTSAEQTEMFAEIERKKFVMFSAPVLAKWKANTYAKVAHLPESDFLALVGETIREHKGDQQFAANKRAGFVTAMESWLARKAAGDSGSREMHALEERIFLESQGHPGSQPLQADFNNLLFLVGKDTRFDSPIPREAMPAVLADFYSRYILPARAERESPMRDYIQSNFSAAAGSAP